MNFSGIRFRASVLITGTLFTATVAAQTVGPNNPSTTGNNAGVGTNAWSSTGNSVSSNDSYASVATKGLSQYLTATNFGFTIPATSIINGIQVDVERSTSGSGNVALLNAWNTGLTCAVSAGTNRLLVVTHAQENGTNSRDITAMTYGGRPMTQAVQCVAGVSGGFNARLEVWYLLEADIALAGSTAITTAGTTSSATMGWLQRSLR